ncbi:hypothetical protein ACFLYO_06645 [Chloroflexota bacterium]
MTANPYQYNSPVTTGAGFAGRREAFNFVQANLMGDQQAALVILGGQHSGKSSFLRVLPEHLDDRYVPVRLSLRAGTVAGEKAWLTALAETIPQALAMVDIQAARLPELPAHPADLRDALQGEYMAVGLRSLRRDRHLLVLVDNAERLLTAVQDHALPRDSFKFLAELLATHDRLDFVLAVDARHESDLMAVGAPFAAGLTYRLGGLLPAEAAALLTAPLPDGVTMTAETLDTIDELTAGQPYLVQLMGGSLFNRIEGREPPLEITVADVAAVTDTVLGMGSEVLASVWRHATPQDQLVLTALSALSPTEPPQPVPHDDIGAWLIAADRMLDPRTVNATWRRLEYEGVLTLAADGKLIINGGLQRRWLREHVTLPEGGGRRVPWRRVALIALAVVLVLAILLTLLSLLPGPEAGPISGAGEATITLDLGLQGTGEAYEATQAAAP